MAIQGARPDDRRISPNLIVRRAEAAVDFYQRALDAELLYASMQDGRLLHAQLRIGETVLLVFRGEYGNARKRMGTP